MKYIFHTKKIKIYFIFLFIFIPLFLSCKKVSYVEIDPISGKYDVIKAVETNTGSGINMPRNLSLYFYKDNALIFGEEFKGIKYASKKVNFSSYSLYYNIHLDKMFQGLEIPEEIYVINLIKSGEIIGEFLKINNSEFFIYKNQAYQLRFSNKLDDVSYAKAKENRKIFKATPIYKPMKTTGAFIGLRDESSGIPNYSTLYIYSDYNSMHVYLADGLVIPKSNGYIIAKNYRNIDGGSYKDNLNISFSQDFNYEEPKIKEIKTYYISETSKIEFASPYMISFKTKIKNFLNNSYKSFYETYSIEKNGLRNKLTTNDIIGEDWLNILISNIYIDYLDDIYYKIVPSDIGIIRRNGYWIITNRLYSDKTTDNIYTRIKPSYLNQDTNRNYLSMEQIKELYTSTIDYSVSPEKTLAIVNTGSNLKIVSLSANDLKIRDSFSIINNDLALIMDYWIVGSEAEAHLYNISNSKYWLKVN